MFLPSWRRASAPFALFGLVAAWAWGRRTGIVLGAVVFSHWVLDLIVHRADMPLLPQNYDDLPRLGFGLWRFPAAPMTVEMAFVVGGAWLYGRAARATAGTALRRRADVSALLVLTFGVLVLATDVSGIFG